MMIRSLAVFCGSKDGTDPVFKQHASRLGKLMASHSITLIYGGGSTGIMGAVADAMMEKFGGDSLREMQAHFSAWNPTLPEPPAAQGTNRVGPS